MIENGKKMLADRGLVSRKSPKLETKKTNKPVKKNKKTDYWTEQNILEKKYKWLRNVLQVLKFLSCQGNTS